MEQTYSVSGMTCEGCAATVRQHLSKLHGVDRVEVDLPKGEATVAMQAQLPISALKAVLPGAYGIEEKTLGAETPVPQGPKPGQLWPLFLIFAYLLTAAVLLNRKSWHSQDAMLDFMGLFYIVFSFFKFLDLKGFSKSFGGYDPLARALPPYGWAYPFLELLLGLSFLLRFQIQFALWATLVVLGTTTIGVAKTLLDKKSIRCACLGTVLNLPMTEATLIENTIMLGMAGWLLV